MSRTTWEPKTAVEKTTIQKYRGKPRQWRMDEAVRLVLEENVSQAEAARMCGVSRPKVNGNVIEKRKMLAAQAERAKQSLEERASLTYETVVPDVSDVPVGPEQTEGWNGSAEPAEVVVRESTQLPEADVRVESDTKPPAQEYITESRRVPTFREFNDLYFSNEVCPDCGVHHETPEFHGQIMDLLEDRSKRMKLINCAPYHAKSTTATLKSTLYELVRDPSSRTAVISAAGDLARAFLYQIKQHLQDPDLYIGAARNLIEDWGPFYNPNAWSADQIYIYGRSGAQKDPSVSVYGFGTQIYGRRFDRMIFDDVAVLDNQNTPEAVEKMHRKIWQEYVNRVGKTGQLIWVGTRVAAGDIYSRLDDIEGMNVLRFPCILDEDEQTMLWPEHFPYQAAVAQRSAMSLEQFQLVYQNVDTLGVNASFTPEMLEAARDRERFIGSYDPSWGLVAGLDPAGANDQAGYTALVLMGIDPVTGIRHIVDLVNIKQMKAPDILSQVYDWAERYPLRELRVETNGLQALALDEKIPTPSGWTTMGAIAPGDQVFAPDGSVTTVLDKSDVKTSNDCYRVNFNDGSSVVTDAGHRWYVTRPSDGKWVQSWTTTGEIARDKMRFPSCKRYVELADPLDLPEADLPIDPYVLGIWLGDGTSMSGQIASDPNNGDQGVLRANLELAGYELKTDYVDPYSTGAIGLRPQLKDLGVLGNKHIPVQYQRASVKQRLALLQGLMDSDGSINEIGHAHFANKNQALIAGVSELLASLGWRPRVNHAADISKVFFSPKRGDLEPFRLQRKLERTREHNGSSRSTTRRLIKSVERVASVPVACIRVAHPSSQFLVGERMVPTGNSQLYQYNAELNQRLVNRGVRLVPHITHGRNKWDPQFGVESMAALFHNRLISLPYGDLNSRAKVRELEDQLLGFPMARTSDLVMAMWFASLGCREFATRTQLPAFDPRMKVPGRIANRRRVMNFADREVRAPSRFDLTGELEPSSRDLVKLANMDSSVLVRG